MDFFWLSFYLVVIAALGSTGVFLAGRDEGSSLPMKLAIIAVFGSGCLGYGLFIFALLGVRSARWPLVCLFTVAIVIVLQLFRKRRPSLRKLRRTRPMLGWGRRAISGILASLLVVFLGVVTMDALTFRLYDGDAFAIWGLKAKVIAAEGIVPRPAYFTDVSLSYSHLDYPLMVPFLMSGIYAVIGRVDDTLAKLFLPVIYFGLMCLVLAFSMRRLSTPTAFAITVSVMGAPVMLRWAGSGNADVPLTAFYTTSIVFLLEWERDPNWRSCALCGVMSAFGAFTKNEGLMLGVLSCGAMFLLAIRGPEWKSRMSGAALCFTIFVGLILPWIIWSGDIPRTHENYVAHLGIQEIRENAFRASIILNEFGRQMVNVWRYGLLWLVLLISAIIRWRYLLNRTILLVSFLLIIHFGVYALIFLVTPWDLRTHLRVALERLVLHVIPMGGLLITLLLSASASTRPPATSGDMSDL